MLSTLLKNIKLDGSWLEINTESEKGCYIIAIKENAGKKDTIKVSKVTRMGFEVGIESGIKNKPLTIQYFNLNFGDITSSDSKVNGLTAFTKLSGLPNKFFIKPIYVEVDNKKIETGIVSIKLNINSI